MCALGKKKHMFFFGNARPKSNARAHLKQRKNIVAIRNNGQNLAIGSLNNPPAQFPIDFPDQFGHENLDGPPAVDVSHEYLYCQCHP